MSEGLGQRPRWRAALPIAVSVVLLWILGRKVDLDLLRTTFQEVDAVWTLSAALVFGLAMMLKAWRWALTLKLRGLSTHAIAAYRNAFIGGFASFFTLGPASGDLVKAALYGRWYGYRVEDVAAAAYLDRLCGVIGWGISTGIALVVSMILGVAASGDLDVGWVFRVFSLAVVFVGFSGLVGWGFWRRNHERGLGRFVDSFTKGVVVLLRTPRTSFWLLLLSIASHVLHTLSGALGFIAVGASAPLWGLLWALPLVNFAASLPISMGGVGVRESVSMWTLGVFEVGGEIAIAGGALWTLWTAMVCLWGGWLWWRAHRARSQTTSGLTAPKSVSVVIPTWNEEEEIGACLERIQSVPEVDQVVVADGGSLDRTLEIAVTFGATALRCRERGRGPQLREGCAAASGDVILILHADTWLDPQCGRAALDCLRDPAVIWGGYWKRFRDGPWFMAGSRVRCLQRLLTAGRVFGDQGIFVRRDAMERIGGHPAPVLMEEFELQRELRRYGRMGLADAQVWTSARRFIEQGVLSTYWRMGWVMFRYRLGASPERLLEIYQRTNREKDSG